MLPAVGFAIPFLLPHSFAQYWLNLSSLIPNIGAHAAYGSRAVHHHGAPRQDGAGMSIMNRASDDGHCLMTTGCLAATDTQAGI